ncbi:hypothetical protein AAG906_038703 [Vitis piasezkii]
MSKAKGKAEAEDIICGDLFRREPINEKVDVWHREKIEATGWELHESVRFRNGHHNKPATEATSGPETWDFGTRSFYSHPCCQL